MFTRGMIPTWIAIIGLSGMFLMGQDTWAPADKFARTESVYAWDMTDAEMDALCASEIGPGFRLATWGEVVAFVQESGLDLFYSQSGMTSYCSNGWVRGFYSSSRRYFVERHDGSVPSGWLVHDTIGNSDIDLGSWYDLRLILCYDPATKSHPSGQEF